MTIKLTLELASGQSLKDAPLELLADGKPIAQAVVGDNGQVAFDANPGGGETGGAGGSGGFENSLKEVR